MEANQQASASFMEPQQEMEQKEETHEDLGHLGSGVPVVLNWKVLLT